MRPALIAASAVRTTRPNAAPASNKSIIVHERGQARITLKSQRLISSQMQLSTTICPDCVPAANRGHNRHPSPREGSAQPHCMVPNSWTNSPDDSPQCVAQLLVLRCLPQMKAGLIPRRPARLPFARSNGRAGTREETSRGGGWAPASACVGLD